MGVRDDLFEIRTRSGERVVPHQGHLSTMASLPPQARLLMSLPSLGYWVPYFDWGPFRHGSTLPRIAAGRRILSLASWAIPGGIKELIGNVADFERWRRERGIPAVVSVGAGDQRIPVNLLSHTGRAELVRAAAAGADRLEEVPWGSLRATT